MLKSYKSLLVLTIFFLCSFSSFAQDAQNGLAETNEPRYKAQLIKKIYSLGTASINGTYYPLGNAIARLIGKNYKKTVIIAEPTAGSVANVDYLRKNRINLALMQSDVAWMAYKGLGEYSGKAFNNLKVLASLYSEKIQIVVRADSNINKLEDLKGKRIAVGDKESGSAAGVIQILEAAGLKKDVDYELIYERFTKSTESILDGYIDAVYYVGAVPADGIVRLSNKVPIKLIEIPSDLVSKLTKDYPFYCPETIKANSYKGVNNTITSLGFKALLTCTDKIPDFEVFTMLSIIYSNPKIMSEHNEVLIELNSDEACMGFDMKMLHEGAVKFFAKNKEN